MRYLSKREIENICSGNSMCRDVFNAFKEKHPALVDRITDLFSRGFVYCFGVIKYELNYQIYEFEIDGDGNIL